MNEYALQRYIKKKKKKKKKKNGERERVPWMEKKGYEEKGFEW